MSDEQLEIQKLKDASKKAWKRNLKTLAKMRANQQAELEAELEQQRQHAASIQRAPGDDTVPVDKLLMINGVVQERQPYQPSIAIARTETFLQMNKEALQKK